MKSILASVPDKTDTGYALGVHLHGLQGTWHRLWGIIAMIHSFDFDVHVHAGVQLTRQQFEKLLDRAMSEQEWQALLADAMHHAETVRLSSQCPD